MLNLHANTREDYGEHRRNSYLGMEILDYRDGVCVMVDTIVNLHANTRQRIELSPYPSCRTLRYPV